MSETRNRRRAQGLFIRFVDPAQLERIAIVVDLRAEAEAYGGAIGEVLLAVARRIERGAK